MSKHAPGQSLFAAERLRRAAWAFTTRRVPPDQAYRIRRGATVPRAGDLVLARVDLIGHHQGLQLRSGRRRRLFPGDEIVVVYGNRYASSQFEAVVPRTLGPCHLVAAGGVAAKARSWHERISRGPTAITPVGLLFGPDDRPANLEDYAVEPVRQLTVPNPPTIVVMGTSMDAGKTTAAAFLVRGLIHAGIRVGYAKVTGTGASGDPWLVTDAGADPVLDFLDAGYVSTYLVPLSKIEEILLTLLTHLTKSGVDAVVLEVADGVLQPETAALLDSPVFKSSVDGVLFAARDSMGAVAGVRSLRDHELHVVGLSGVLTAAPLERAEAAAATRLPVLSREDLAEGETARQILASARDRRVRS
jgi:AAA domain-containing protein